MKKPYEYGYSRVEKPHEYKYFETEEPHEYGYFRLKKPYKNKYPVAKRIDRDVQTRQGFQTFGSWGQVFTSIKTG